MIISDSHRRVKPVGLSQKHIHNVPAFIRYSQEHYGFLTVNVEQHAFEGRVESNVQNGWSSGPSVSGWHFAFSYLLKRMILYMIYAGGRVKNANNGSHLMKSY